DRSNCLPGSLPGSAARADRGEDERPASQAKRDHIAAAGPGSDGGAQAQPGAGNRRGKAETQSCRRSPADQPVAANVRREKGDSEACAHDGPTEPSPQSLSEGFRRQRSPSSPLIKRSGTRAIPPLLVDAREAESPW